MAEGQSVILTAEQFQHLASVSNRLEEYRKELESLKNAQIPQTPSSGPTLPLSPRQPKVHPPETFGGERTKLPLFLAQLNIYMSL